MIHPAIIAAAAIGAAYTLTRIDWVDEVRACIVWIGAGLIIFAACMNWAGA